MQTPFVVGLFTILTYVKMLHFKELGDDEDDVNSFVLFDIEEKLKSSKYDKNFVREMLGPDLTVSYMQKEGFNNPIIVKSKEGLGLNVPNVTVKDVRGLVKDLTLLEFLLI